jgi:hypothetical protein
VEVIWDGVGDDEMPGRGLLRRIVYWSAAITTAAFNLSSVTAF